MIDMLKRSGVLSSRAAINAFAAIDRAWFLPGRPAESQYEDQPQSITRSAYISAPSYHARVLELLTAVPCGLVEGKVLEIGSGSGFLTTVLAHLVGPTGSAKGVEASQRLVSLSRSLVQGSPVKSWLDVGRLEFVESHWTVDAPLDDEVYNVIHVGAAAPSLPKELIKQLAPGGRLVVPIGTSTQELVVVDKAKAGSGYSIKKCGDIKIALMFPAGLRI